MAYLRNSTNLWVILYFYFFYSRKFSKLIKKGLYDNTYLRKMGFPDFVQDIATIYKDKVK